MKNLHLLAIIICIPLNAWGAPPDLSAQARRALEKAGLTPLKDARPARDWTLKTLDGKTVSLTSLRGRIVFLNFWAAWCPPCRAEMPSIEALYQRFKDADIEFFAIDAAENAKTVQKFVQDQALHVPVLLDDDGKVSRDYRIQAIPATVVVGRDGTIILSSVGGRNWNSREVIAAFEALSTHGR
ncbi:MAG: TlpA family protein disulfide reductase [Spirochaetaceae bacterium]|jgi:peroxiredoxin|nr:TlpA family protein disulfide reductase [Spirochaetaceae bacterium]